MKAKDLLKTLRQDSLSTLAKKLQEQNRDYQLAVTDLALRKSRDHTRSKKIRRLIARIQTVIREKLVEPAK